MQILNSKWNMKSIMGSFYSFILDLNINGLKNDTNYKEDYKLIKWFDIYNGNIYLKSLKNKSYLYL